MLVLVLVLVCRGSHCVALLLESVCRRSHPAPPLPESARRRSRPVALLPEPSLRTGAAHTVRHGTSALIRKPPARVGPAVSSPS